ncbi:hypothetical protein [Anaerococcus vaginimassiliensis]|uniref:hypothetical protein n=1 Tax=Anaerococcus vaginimassiliensis TaxID=2042308 RepID=UPI0010312A44|nr:hypothetical protein [Anaerococcus vaginimassiliensis]
MNNMNQPNKKPFYKKTWFKIIAVLFVLGAIGNIINPPEKESNNTASQTNKNISNSNNQKSEGAESQLSKNEINQESNIKNNKTISDEDYKFYNEIMDHLNADVDRPEEDILEEIAPNYNMTVEEIQNKMRALSDAAVERYSFENQEKRKEKKNFLDENKVYVQTASQNFVEEAEMKKLKGFAPSSSWQVSMYSGEEIKDLDGNSYPYSFRIAGRYEEKGTGNLYDFLMVLAYKTESDIKDVKANCLQYLNTTNGNYYDNIVDEDNDLLKMEEFMQDFDN